MIAQPGGEEPWVIMAIIIRRGIRHHRLDVRLERVFQQTNTIAVFLEVKNL
jgi:hypothetical protein